MKLTFSPASPFARKVRIAAIELRLIDRIEFVPTTVVPGQPNDEYSNLYPLKKLPALILDNGDVIVDSYVIVEYLDEFAGGGKLIPVSGPTRCCCAAMRRWCARRGCNGRHGPTITGTGRGRAWRTSRSRRICCRGRSISRRSALPACSATPISASPIAAGAKPIRNSIPSTKR